jgi:hypothetical protein
VRRKFGGVAFSNDSFLDIGYNLKPFSVLDDDGEGKKS